MRRFSIRRSSAASISRALQKSLNHHGESSMNTIGLEDWIRDNEHHHSGEEIDSLRVAHASDVEAARREQAMKDAEIVGDHLADSGCAGQIDRVAFAKGLAA